MRKPRPAPERVVLPLPKDLLDEIDEYRWANRIPSRAEAIRQLIKDALQAKKPK